MASSGNIVSTSDGVLTFTLVSIETKVESNCKILCPNDDDCYYVKYMMNGSLSTDFIHNAVVVDITNETDNLIKVNVSDFKAVDKVGITHNSIELCDRFSMGLSSKDSKIFPKSTTRFRIIFQPFDTPQ